MSYSNDELSAIIRTDQPSFQHLLDGAIRGDGHPAGTQVWLYFYTKAFGTGELAVRLPFVLSGVACILFVFLIGRAWFSETSGLLAALAIALLQFPIVHSQLARPYMPGTLWVLMSVYFLTRIVLSGRLKWYDVVLWSMASVLACYTHYFSALAVIITGTIGLFVLQRPKLKWFLLGAALAAAAFIPHISYSVSQLQIGGLSWLPPPGASFPSEHLQVVFGGSSLVLFGMFALLAWSIWKCRKHITWSKWHSIALLLFFVPILIGLLWSVLVKPVLQHRVLIFTMPFALLWVTSFFPRSYERSWMPIGVSGFLLLFSLVIEKQFFKEPHTEPFKEVAETGAKWLGAYSDEAEVLSIAHTNAPEYLNFYLNRHGYEVRFPVYKCCDKQPIESLESALADADSFNQQHVMLLVPRGSPDPSVEPLILKHFSRVLKDEGVREGMATLYGKRVPATEWDSITRDSFLTAPSDYQFLGLGHYVCDGSEVMVQVAAAISAAGIADNNELVISVDRFDETIMWSSVQLSRYGTGAGQTRHAVLSLDLHDLQPGDHINAFVWNHDGQRIWAEDNEFVVFRDAASR